MKSAKALSKRVLRQPLPYPSIVNMSRSVLVGTMALVFAALAMQALVSAQSAPIGMYLTCYGTSTCEGRPWKEHFFNESDFDQPKHRAYGPGYSVLYQTALEGNCSSATIYSGSLGEYRTGGCHPHPDYVSDSCYAACHPHIQTAGYITLELEATRRKRSQTDSLDDHATRDFSTITSITDWLQENYQFDGAPQIETYYTVVNTPGVCHTLHNATAGFFGAHHYIGSPYFAKTDSYCEFNTDASQTFSFGVYSDSSCTNLVTTVTGPTDAETYFPVAAPIAIQQGSNFRMTCQRFPGASSPSPSAPSPSPAPSPVPSPAPVIVPGPSTPSTSSPAATPSAQPPTSSSSSLVASAAPLLVAAALSLLL